LLAGALDAPADWLASVLEHEALGPDVVALILRNRAATVPLVTQIGRNRDWMRDREVRVAFVGNPLAPTVLSRQVLPHLFWTDLADVACNARLSPVLRREAERILRSRLPEFSTGERIALARRPSRGVIEMLCEDGEAAVLTALAANPRVTRSDIARILGRAGVPPAFLSWLASSTSWSGFQDLVHAMVRHPGMPAAAALRLVAKLSAADLERVLRDALAPRLVRVAAERRLVSQEGVG